MYPVRGMVNYKFRLSLIITNPWNWWGGLGGCGSFFAIEIESKAFEGLTTVKQHKLVSESLKSEIEGMHGLQV